MGLNYALNEIYFKLIVRGIQFYTKWCLPTTRVILKGTLPLPQLLRLFSLSYHLVAISHSKIRLIYRLLQCAATRIWSVFYTGFLLNIKRSKKINNYFWLIYINMLSKRPESNNRRRIKMNNLEANTSSRSSQEHD